MRTIKIIVLASFIGLFACSSVYASNSEHQSVFSKLWNSISFSKKSQPANQTSGISATKHSANQAKAESITKKDQHVLKGASEDGPKTLHFGITKKDNQTDASHQFNTEVLQKLISLNFNDIKTRHLLQIMAQFVHMNFVISDSVSGNMSIHLNNVPWGHALDVILKSQGLGKRVIGTIIIIGPVKELARNEITELQAKQQMEKLQPLFSRIIHLRYADAEKITTLLQSVSKSLLSSRGQVGYEKRTNSLWITAPRTKLYLLIRLVRRLDTPVKQVLIEARIVEVQNNFERELGARFGLSGGPNNMSGTIAGANGIAAGTALPTIPVASRLNFNLPSVPTFGPAGSIAIAVAKIGGRFLDLELSALEQEGKIHLISSPRLVTSNQQPAYIETGEEIPYQTATSSGATAIEFKNAVLSLKVIPQTTPRNRVILHLTVTNNKQGASIALQPTGTAIAIDTQEEQSTVLVNNGQTIVLGGVYTQNKRHTITRIPFLGALPIIGHLFKNNKIVNKHLELLIFLTPHIISKPSQLS